MLDEEHGKRLWKAERGKGKGDDVKTLLAKSIVCLKAVVFDAVRYDRDERAVEF